MSIYNYDEFLNNKLKFGGFYGFNPDSISNKLYDFQKEIVKMALRRGRYAIFADCGLGKTLMQLEWARQIFLRENKSILIVAPLAVSLQTKREGLKLGLNIKICRSQEDIILGINITNYEMLHKFNPDEFIAIVLDESSILKSHTGKYRTMIIDMFANTKYKLSCTATPAPNDFVEIGNQCEFLNVMSRKEMLSMFFINDTSNVGTWRLKGHAENKFFEWMCSWSVMVRCPSDIGFDDDRFKLPELNINEILVDTNDKPIDGMLFAMEARTLQERRSARKASIEFKINKAVELTNNNEQWLIWTDLNDESKMCAKSIKDAVEVTGSDSSEHKEKSVIDFANGDIRVLVTKPKIAGFGINWQSCHNIIFIGLSDSYESFYQAIRRCWRYGQKHNVNVYILTSRIEGEVINNIKRKEKDTERMFSEMIKKASVYTKKSFAVNTEYKEESEVGDGWKLLLGDCVDVVKSIDDKSIHYSLFSPPFASLFTYSNSDRDMGNCKGKEDFLEHFHFLTKELYRVLMPGRLLSFHVMNLPSTISQDGFIGIKDLRGDLIRAFEKVGFIFHSEVCIWKDPLVQATRTKTLTLAHKQISKDASRCGQGFADYIITMRKQGDNPEPVSKGRGFETYIGEMEEPKAIKTNNAKTNKYSHYVWQRYASPVWMDIRQTRVLNARNGRDQKDEKHMCPLQLDVIERCYELWTNEGDIVLSPFAGIGSEGYCAIKQNRKFIGIELKESYFNEAVKNLRIAETEKQSLSLF